MKDLEKSREKGLTTGGAERTLSRGGTETIVQRQLEGLLIPASHRAGLACEGGGGEARGGPERELRPSEGRKGPSGQEGRSERSGKPKDRKIVRKETPNLAAEG